MTILIPDFSRRITTLQNYDVNIRKIAFSGLKRMAYHRLRKILKETPDMLDLGFFEIVGGHQLLYHNIV